MEPKKTLVLGDDGQRVIGPDGKPAVKELPDPIGFLRYNGLQTSWDKRLTHGFHVLAAYTFSKSTQATSVLNMADDGTTTQNVVTTALGDGARASIFSSAATDLAPFEGDLRSTFGASHAELPVRALHFARAAAKAASRDEAFDRGLGVARLLLVQGADPETIAAALISQAIPEKDLDLEAVQSAFGAELAVLLRGLARAGRLETRDGEAEFGIELQNSDKFTAGYSGIHEFLPRPFRIASNVTLPIVHSSLS